MARQEKKSSQKMLSIRRAGDRAARALLESLESRLLLSTAPLRPDHVVVVVESDRFANALGDSANLPYVNQLAAGGLVFSNYQGINVSTDAGEKNYLALYSGSSQGITDNARGYSFSTTNLAQSLNSTPGLSFAGFSESLPSDGAQDQQAGDAVHPDLYTRNHNPMAMFTNAGTGKINADVNKTFADFTTIGAQASSYANLPTVSFVVPNNLDNTNGSNEAAPFATDPGAYAGLRQSADTWLRQNLDAYAQWAKTHNSLLLIVGNEGDRQHNFAAGTETIITGDPRLFVPGTDTNSANHFNTLRTIEDMYGIAPLGNSATAVGLDTNALGQLAAPVSLLATTAVVTSSANPATGGQAVTFTATISAVSGTPAGTVTFLDGATSLGSGTLNAAGVATLSTSALSIATHAIKAAYGGSAAFQASTSAAINQVVNSPVATGTTTAVTSSANPSAFGQSITLSASVTPAGAGTPTGIVTFKDGNATLGTATLNAAGTAAFTTSTLAGGSHSITAAYGGDVNFTPSTSPAISQVVGQSAIVRPDHVVILIEEDRAANAIGDVVNLPYLNQLASAGLVYSNSHGLNDITQLGELNYLALFSGSTQGVIDDGRGYTFTGPNLAQSLNDTGLSFGSYAELLPSDGSQAQQAGDATRPDIYTRSYNAAAMFTNVGTGKTNADVNKTFASFSAIGSQTNTYANLPTISFVIPDNLNNTHGSNEAAPFATDPGAYNGLRQSADNWLKQNIDAYVQWAKTHNSLLIITGDEGDRAHNFAGGITTIVTGDPRLVVPGVDATSINHYNTLRTIEDFYGVAPLGSSASASHFDINASGQLAAPLGTLPTTTALSSSLNPAVTGQAVTFTSTVSGGGTPSGSVTFKDGATVLGTAVINASGVATLTTTTLAAAAHSITAVYTGDSIFVGSTSAVLTQTITQPVGPVNDVFANRITIPGSSATLSGTNVNATKEIGEPKHAGSAGGKSVWWTWTAPAAGTVTIDTTGSSFDTLLATYTGSGISSLTAVKNGSNDDNPAGGTFTSLVKFSVTAGTVYQIAVDGYNGASGTISLHLNFALAKPAAPTNVAATNGTLTDRVRVIWTPTPGATGYQVWRGTVNQSSTALQITSADISATLFDDTTAVSGIQYFYWIKATNSAGASGFSGSASGKRG